MEEQDTTKDKKKKEWRAEVKSELCSGQPFILSEFLPVALTLFYQGTHDGMSSPKGPREQGRPGSRRLSGLRSGSTG